jgi:hypothetical protein
MSLGLGWTNGEGEEGMGAGALRVGEGWACTDLLAFKRTGREPMGNGDRHGRSTSGSGGMGSG